MHGGILNLYFVFKLVVVYEIVFKVLYQPANTCKVFSWYFPDGDDGGGSIKPTRHIGAS
jgi:hypothetical protein